MDRIHCYLPGWDVPKISGAVKTDHFGLLSDFLSECWGRLRSQSRVAVLQGRLTYGGALSGRDQNAATKTITGLLKLIHPSPEDPGADKLSGTDVGRNDARKPLFGSGRLFRLRHLFRLENIK